MGILARSGSTCYKYMLGDIINVILGTEPGAVVGIPVVVAILTYMMGRRVRGASSEEKRASDLCASVAPCVRPLSMENLYGIGCIITNKGKSTGFGGSFLSCLAEWSLRIRMKS